ncbi:MAG: dihydrolipoamide acetyltransferase family protein, partial [Candidatus Geothermarchaeales archaeon]
GVLARIIQEEGSEVPVTESIAIITEPGEPLPAATPRPVPRIAAEARAKRVLPISPAARRLAREHSIDYAPLAGSGPGGRIVKADIEAEIQKQRLREVPEPPGLPRVAEVIPLSGTRKTVAERLSYSHRTTVPVHLAITVDMEEVLRFRAEIQQATEVPISLTAFVTKAVATALERHSILNSALEGGRIKVHEDINVAVAIHRPEGLVAPVIRGADTLTVEEISQRISDLTGKAVQGELSVGDMTGGTFTVSNLGEVGVEFFAPVINPPQTGILGVGRISKRPLARDDTVQVRHAATLSLVFDHRVVDGVPSGKFLDEVKKLLESPDKLL